MTGRDESICSNNGGGRRRTAADAEAIIAGMGGAGNIIEIEPCITRLRTVVHDPSKIDEAVLRAAGTHGVMATGTVIQVVVGPETNKIASDIKDLIE